MISVVYVPRSGSRFFSRKIADQSGYEWLGEVLNPRTYPCSDIRSSILKDLNNGREAVIKLGVWQADVSTLRSFLNKSHKIYLCYRANFDQQVRSMYAATAQNVNNYHADIDQTHITFDSKRYSECANWMMTQYTETVKMLKDLKVELILYESFATVEGKYCRNFIWNQEPPHIDFEVNKIVDKLKGICTYD
jgi:hypothetical protein